ncbi:MAG: CbiX/SirB N-terminal domain-containing protein [Firmicutes bacterium]|nr:CbiX/SirB N-terminal domain-containing protein [Bacillota bacterium]
MVDERSFNTGSWQQTAVFIPMFLFDGIHVTQDISSELEMIMAKHPGIEVRAYVFGRKYYG